MPRTLEEQDLVDKVWKQINKVHSLEEFSAFKTLIQKGISEEDSLLAAPIVHKNPRSPREQAVITKIWKQLVNIDVNDSLLDESSSSYQADLKLATEGFLEGKSLFQIKQNIEVNSQNFNIKEVPGASHITLVNKIQYLDLICTEAYKVFKSSSKEIKQLRDHTNYKLKSQ